MSISNITTSLSGTYKKLGKNIEGSSYYCILIILLPIDYSYSLFFLIISSKRKREKIGGTIKTSNAMRSFSLVNFGPRREAESVLDTAPNT